ncbi:hypothetical protein D0868_00979 [Hortaea werneckii]|uniref:Tyrosine specific protein phosphatases domain-containing protein n=1 Tax=Hortaea werneckii TaxID=91943 RepID=A0A3M6ZJG0_HORWE|nr:hypothetical protein D0868_00979 [Hortaea werneckii]
MDEKAPLQSIINFRDVGIATGGSAALPAGRLYRCYDIDKATREDQKYLRRILGMSTLINLNGPLIVIGPTVSNPLKMVFQHQDRIRSFSVLDITVHEISLESQSFRDRVSEMVPWTDKLQFLGRGKECTKTMVASFDRIDWRETTTNFLDLSKRQIQAIFLALAEQDACPVLIYGACTGLVLCLLLHLLGIPEEKIIHEYLLTRQSEAAMLEQVNARRREIGLEEKASLNLEPGYVRHVLGHLETKYRSIDAYLESAGLNAQQLDDVKANLRGRDVREDEKLVDVEEREVS